MFYQNNKHYQIVSWKAVAKAHFLQQEARAILHINFAFKTLQFWQPAMYKTYLDIIPQNI